MKRIFALWAFLTAIVWKDLLKPRYAIIVEIGRHPDIKGHDDQGNVEFGYTRFPAVMSVPYKRPLNVPFNSFYNGLCGKSKMVIAGQYWTLRNLYGVGSCLKHNIDSAVTYVPPKDDSLEKALDDLHRITGGMMC